MRHGEAEWNVIGKTMGHLDSPLTNNGIVQVKNAKNKINVSFDTIVSSDLGRALETANIFGKPVKSKLLRERFHGVNPERDNVLLKRFKKIISNYEETNKNVLIVSHNDSIITYLRSIGIFVDKFANAEYIKLQSVKDYVVDVLNWVKFPYPINLFEKNDKIGNRIIFGKYQFWLDKPPTNNRNYLFVEDSDILERISRIVQYIECVSGGWIDKDKHCVFFEEKKELVNIPNVFTGTLDNLPFPFTNFSDVLRLIRHVKRNIPPTNFVYVGKDKRELCEKVGWKFIDKRSFTENNNLIFK